MRRHRDQCPSAATRCSLKRSAIDNDFRVIAWAFLGLRPPRPPSYNISHSDADWNRIAIILPTSLLCDLTHKAVWVNLVNGLAMSSLVPSISFLPWLVGAQLNNYGFEWLTNCWLWWSYPDIFVIPSIKVNLPPHQVPPHLVNRLNDHQVSRVEPWTRYVWLGKETINGIALRDAYIPSILCDIGATAKLKEKNTSFSLDQIDRSEPPQWSTAPLLGLMQLHFIQNHSGLASKLIFRSPCSD